MALRLPLASTALLLLTAAGAQGCDLCAVSAPVEAKRGQDDEGALGGTQSGTAPVSSAATEVSHRPGSGWSVGLIAEDIDSTVARDGGRRADGEQEQDLYHQRLTTRMLELMVLYRIDSRIGVRAYVPYYDRTYQTFAVAGTGVAGVLSGEVRGVGDMTVEATDLVLRAINPQHVVLGTVLVGASLPTGESSQLVQEEEIAQGLSPDGHVHTGSGVQSLVHPHDLALGSGSIDGLAGLTLYARSGAWFASGRVIGRERNRGRAGYRYGDTLTWAGGPGYQRSLGETGMVALQAYLTGEAAAPDHVAGQVVANSGDTTLFLGPELSGTWDGHLAAEAGIDLPLVERTDGQQVMPRYRLHAGIDWSF